MQHSDKTTKLYSGIKPLKNPSGAVSSPRVRVPRSEPVGPLAGVTREQKIQLGTWAEQRDLLLKEIAANTDSNNKLIEKGKELSNSLTEMTDRKTKLSGTLEEMERQEIEQKKFLTKEVSDLIIKKTGLETAITGLEKILEILGDKKAGYTADIETIMALHNKVFSRASILDEVVKRVVHVNEHNINQVNTMIADLKKTTFDVSTSLTTLHEGIVAGSKNAEGAVARTIKMANDFSSTKPEIKEELTSVPNNLGK